MLKPNQLIEIKWHNQTRDWYESKGYVFTKYQDRLIVKAEDLSVGCHKKVKVICDYCNNEFETEYVQHLRSEENHGDCCNACRSKKTEKIMLETYGVKNMFQTDHAKNKSKETCLKKYGTEMACQSKEVREKIEQANLEKYGYKSALCNPDVVDKRNKTMVDRYGVDNLFRSNDFQRKLREKIFEEYGCNNIAQVPYIAEKIKQTNLDKFGTRWSTQAESVKAKMRESLYKNGNVPSSSLESKFISLLKEIYGEENCVPSYPFGSLNLDCLLTIDGQKIDCEYDGWYWHKDRVDKDRKRNYFLIKNGYKVFRVESKTSLPTKEEIIKSIDYLVKDNHYYEKITLDI